MAGLSQLSPVTDIPLSPTDQSLSPVLMDSSVKDLTGQLEEMDSYPFACGGYSYVFKYRARDSSVGLSTSASGDVFAVKTPSVKLCIGDSRKGLNKLRREIGVWVSLDHRNVLKLHGVLYRGGNLLPSLVSDYMENGTACDYLRNNAEASIIHLICDIAKGLSYMHGKGIAHGDIKGDNVLITHNGCARIGDFGLSRTLGHDGSATEMSTTDGNRANRWTAMEYLNFIPSAPQGPTKAGDVWSLGCTVLQLFSGRLPFYDAINDAEVVIRLAPPKQELPSFPPSLLRQDFERFRKGVTAFCRLCWVKEPAHRPTIDVLECIICSFCSGPTCTCLEELNEASQGTRSTLLKARFEGSSRIASNDIYMSDGTPSRTSSQSTVTPDSIVNQAPDPPEALVAEPEEELKLANSLGAISREHAERSEVNSDLSIPFSAIPLPPPASLEAMLHYRCISAQMALNELSQAMTGINVRYVDGESTGPSHSRTYVVICIVNNEEYGVGSVTGKKKHARERAASVALERLYLEYPAYFPALRYSPILTSHLISNSLSARATWTTQSEPSVDHPDVWVYRKIFTFDGIRVADGIGSSSAIAEEAAARNVALAWHHAAANET